MFLIVRCVLLTIEEVKTRSQLKKFIQFQNDLYKNVENYVPTLMVDELQNLTPSKNPAFEYCESRQWLCYRDGEIVGRVGAIVSHAANSIWGQNNIRFTRMDYIEDYDVFCLLIQQVIDWARELKLTRILGPLGFCDFDKEGLLIKGFEHMGLFITYYNHPYYSQFLERYGFEKEVDWVECKIRVDDRNDERMKRISRRVLEKHNLKMVELKNKRILLKYAPQMLDLIDEAYRNLFQVVPLTDAQKKYYISQFVTLINLDYVGVIVDQNDRAVCIGIMAPNLAKPIKKCGGRLFPFGWVSLLRTIKHPEALDMYFVAVKDEYKSAGVPSVLLYEINQRALANGIKFVETGPELEYNYNVLGLWDGYDTDRGFKRRRCYRYDIPEK